MVRVFIAHDGIKPRAASRLRVFAVDVLRCPFGADADRNLIGVLSRAQNSDVIDSFLRAIGEPAVSPPRAKARPPLQPDISNARSNFLATLVR